MKRVAGPYQWNIKKQAYYRVRVKNKALNIDYGSNGLRFAPSLHRPMRYCDYYFFNIQHRPNTSKAHIKRKPKHVKETVSLAVF